MRPTVAFDTETFLTSPGNSVATMVCLTWAEDDKSGILTEEAACHWFLGALRGRHLLVGANTAYEMGVMLRACREVLGVDARQLVIAAYEDDRVRDILIREKLTMLALEGNLKMVRASLGALSMKYLDQDMSQFKKGQDVWRMRYNELYQVPTEEWPQKALDYAIGDAVATLRIWEKTQHAVQADNGYVVHNDGTCVNETFQVRASLALLVTACWGMRTDEEHLNRLAVDLDAIIESSAEVLRECEWARPLGSKSFKDMKRIEEDVELIAAEAGIIPALTKGGKIATAKKALLPLMNADPRIAALLDHGFNTKRKNDFVNKLYAGRDHPICCRYTTLVNSGRTSSSKPNLQQIPRAGGFREAFVARLGYVFVFADYDSLELRSWAQVLKHVLGDSVLAARYQEDPSFDPHTFFASYVLQIPYEDAMQRKRDGDPELKNLRNLAKMANFGFMGGMGVSTFEEYCFDSFGVRLKPGQAEELREQWLAVWTEAAPYLKWISSMCGSWGQKTTITQYWSGRQRAACGYTDAANTLFQGLASDGAKLAMWEIMKATWTEGNALYGSHLCVFIHDEFGLEVPEENYSLAVDQLVSIMCEQMQVVTPDIPIRAGAAVTRRWLKGAESERLEDGTWTIVS